MNFTTGKKNKDFSTNFVPKGKRRFRDESDELIFYDV
jgi:hypothetical protein